MSHLLMNPASRDRAIADAAPKAGRISTYVSGLHQRMVQMSQSWQPPSGNPRLTRYETQHSRYLANFSTQEG